MCILSLKPMQDRVSFRSRRKTRYDFLESYVLLVVFLRTNFKRDTDRRDGDVNCIRRAHFCGPRGVFKIHYRATMSRAFFLLFLPSKRRAVERIAPWPYRDDNAVGISCDVSVVTPLSFTDRRPGKSKPWFLVTPCQLYSTEDGGSEPLPSFLPSFWC